MSRMTGTYYDIPFRISGCPSVVKYYGGEKIFLLSEDIYVIFRTFAKYETHPQRF